MVVGILVVCAMVAAIGGATLPTGMIHSFFITLFLSAKH